MPEINDKNIKAAGFEFEQLDPNVFLIKDFISEEECNFFYNLAESKTQEDWLGAYLEGIKDRAEARYGTRDLEETDLEVTHNWNDKVIFIVDTIKQYGLDERLESLFDKDANLSFRPFGIIQRQYTGSELGGHYDQYVDDRMKWAAVIYINEDYVDGEFYFSEKQIAIKPPRRSMLVFPATEEYWHGVKMVGEGPTRYAMPSFVWSEPDIF
jgi:hypothetical protein